MTLENLPHTSSSQTRYSGATDETISQIRNKYEPLVSQVNSRLPFRRVMFQSQFQKETNKLLDDLSLDFFMQTTGWFDEVVIVKIEHDGFHPVYDFSLRSHEKEGIQIEEFEKLAKIGNELGIGDWDYNSDEQGSNFDMVGRINQEYLLCVNNTNASIDELEQKYPNRIFEEVKPVIERTIAIMKTILSD